MSASNQNHSPITIVDENDENPRAATFDEAVEHGLIRRASRVFVFDQSGRLLVQRRSEHIAKPNLLDQSAAGHVDAGETYEGAAVRELAEEIGLVDVPLTEVALSVRTRSFFNAIYKCVVESDTQFRPDEYEVAELMWFEVSELNTLMETEPERFNPDFREAWELIGDRIIST